MGKAFIVIGDKTSHGGTVTEGTPFSLTGGQRIVRRGDHVYCPKCRKTTIIIEGDQTLIVDGEPVALDGHKTSCGAVLISSQRATTKEYGNSATTGANSFASFFSPYVAEEDDVRIKQYDEQFLLNDGNGQPLPNTYYTAKLPTGELVHGVTDEDGKTARYATNSAHQIEIHIGHQDNS